MGLKSGFIAMGSSLASGCVNVCLVPEFNYDLYGKDGVLEYVNQRAQKKGNCIVVLAEGTSNKDLKGFDAFLGILFILFLPFLTISIYFLTKTPPSLMSIRKSKMLAYSSKQSSTNIASRKETT